MSEVGTMPGCKDQRTTTKNILLNKCKREQDYRGILGIAVLLQYPQSPIQYTVI
jgi:hypothetical protein